MTFDPATIRREILRLVAQPGYKPQKPKKFLPLLKLEPEDGKALRKLVREMILRGEVAYGKNHFLLPLDQPAKIGPDSVRMDSSKSSTSDKSKKREAKKKSEREPSESASSLITGRFQRRPSGIGFVRPRYANEGDTPAQDIFIPAHWTRDAASGDTVAVEIMERRPSKNDYGKSTRTKKGSRYEEEQVQDRGPRGRVVEILERASNCFVGTYIVEGGWGHIQVDGSLFKRKIPVGDASSSTAQMGDKIVVEMVKFPTPHNDGEAVITEVLGPHGVPGTDTLLILRQFALPEHFSEATLTAARNEVEKFFKMFPDDATNSEADRKAIAKKLASVNRLDLTGETIITIDPADAKDFDDAISLEKMDNGNWRLGVHIADVSHFVSKKSPIDREASDRATSVYLPDRVIPMLPEVLSNALASLQPNRIRFTKSVFMEFTPAGVRTHTEIYRSAIRSAWRFDYTEVQDFYDDPSRTGKDWPPVVRELLSNLHRVMTTLRNMRLERGSLELNIPAPKIELDDNGVVIGAHVYPYYDSNRVIEECMLAANEAVADFLHEKEIPFLRRIHSGPSMRKLLGFTDFLRCLDVADLDASDLYQDRFSIQNLLNSVQGTAQEYAVNFSLLRSMQKAIYSHEPEGHYALASKCYAHFTSPIRRYPDLSVHRLLDEILSGKVPKPELRELVLLGEHCSDKEQRAEQAERELVKLKLIDYMSRHLGEQIEAVVTTVESFGIFVMGLDIPVEGLIRLEALNDDFYRFERNAKILMGQREGNTLRIGDRLLVEAVRADPESRQIDFRMVKRIKAEQTSAKPNKTKVRRTTEKKSTSGKRKT